MKPLILAIALSFGADAATTHVGLASGRARETLLPTQNPYVIDAIIAGEVIEARWSLGKMHEHHPKLALTIGWIAVGLRATVAVHNGLALR